MGSGRGDDGWDPGDRTLSGFAPPVPEQGGKPLPSHLGPYRVSGHLGTGGMGEVYRARDETLDRAVAIKVIRPELLTGSHPLGSARERFRHEARAAARLNHPNIVQVFHVLETETVDALVMELVEGRSLSALLKDAGKGRRPRLEDALRWTRQIALGLGEAHGKGIIHRDLKPANVMVTPKGQVKVLDFGLAKGQDAGGEVLTAVGQVVGSYDSMSPEQARSRSVGPRSDLFSLGVLLYEMVAGEKPFRADSPMSTLTQICSRPHAPLRTVDPSVPAAVEALVDRLLAKRPADRPASAEAVADELAALIDGLGEGPKKDPGDDGGASPWRPAPGAEVPGRPRWRLEGPLDAADGAGEAREEVATAAWRARHSRTGERRVLRFCFDAEHLRTLQRETVLFRLLKEELGGRADIAKILDWRFEKPPFYIESEYTEGGDLADWFRAAGGAERIPLEVRRTVVARVARALGAAHSVGVLHKDVRPGNILITVDASGDPWPKLANFGIGSLVDRRRLESSSITHVPWQTEAEAQSGSRLYGAPEVVKGERATIQGDVYSLGVLLYQLVVGDLDRALAPGWEEEVEDPLLRGDIAAAVDGRTEFRLQSAVTLAERLERLEERRGEEEDQRRAAARSAALERRAREVRRRRRLGTLMVVVLGLLGGTTTLQTARLFEQRARANQEAATAKAVSDFLTMLFSSSDPLTALGPLDISEILDLGAERVRREFSDRPGIQARLLLDIAQIYGSLGIDDAAFRELRASRESLRRAPPDPSTEVLLHWVSADLAHRSGDLESVERAVDRALELHRTTDLDPRLESRGRKVLRRLGRLDEARELGASSGRTP